MNVFGDQYIFIDVILVDQCDVMLFLQWTEGNSGYPVAKSQQFVKQKSLEKFAQYKCSRVNLITASRQTFFVCLQH